MRADLKADRKGTETMLDVAVVGNDALAAYVAFMELWGGKVERAALKNFPVDTMPRHLDACFDHGNLSLREIAAYNQAVDQENVKNTGTDKPQHARVPPYTREARMRMWRLRAVSIALGHFERATRTGVAYPWDHFFAFVNATKFPQAPTNSAPLSAPITPKGPMLERKHVEMLRDGSRLTPACTLMELRPWLAAIMGVDERTLPHFTVGDVRRAAYTLYAPIQTPLKLTELGLTTEEVARAERFALTAKAEYAAKMAEHGRRRTALVEQAF